MRQLWHQLAHRLNRTRGAVVTWSVGTGVYGEVRVGLLCDYCHEVHHIHAVAEGIFP